MKKITLLLCVTLTVMLMGGQKVKLSTVVNGDVWMKGFSAVVKTTSNMPGMPKMDPYTIYTDSEGNSRTDMKDNISLYITEGKKQMVYSYVKSSKTYTMMSLSDLPGGEDQKPGFEKEQLVEKVGSETFAGVKCDKYKIDMKGEEAQGDAYMFIDPARKVFAGMEMKMGEYSMKMEYTDIKFGVDKSMFKPLEGYKKTEGFPMGGFNR
ncbi:MAG: hypothetical protein A2Y39_01195 [Candidatus Delongbacteria bacterium GWF2_40_14]|nr:MAG: hypothetical protein A2Y39_01195 [Candidatus Delongbacteria bacterium GWF2_40_14]